jgi:hypothetical protein
MMPNSRQMLKSRQTVIDDSVTPQTPKAETFIIYQRGLEKALGGKPILRGNRQ